jgi:hypothetical protein
LWWRLVSGKRSGTAILKQAQAAMDGSAPPRSASQGTLSNLYHR